MLISLIVHPGLEPLAALELQELLHIPSVQKPSFLEASLTLDQLLLLLQHGQSFRRLLLTIGTFSSADIQLPPFPWQDILVSGMAYSIDLEHVQGGDLRYQLMKKIQGQLALAAPQAGITSLTFTFKKPDAVLVVHWTGQEYIVGIDLAGSLYQRQYRVFPNSAGLTGDIAYALVRKSGFQPQERLLSGLCKDGSVPLEAALFASRRPVRRGLFACQRFPLFAEAKQVSLPEVPLLSPIEAFDYAKQNIIASQKNAKIGAAANLLSFHHYALDDLDVKYDKGEFDHLIFQVTTKDEERINEIMYQARFLLKPKGTLLLMTRQQFELSLPEDFTFQKKEDLLRGDSVHRLWIVQKK